MLEAELGSAVSSIDLQKNSHNSSLWSREHSSNASKTKNMLLKCSCNFARNMFCSSSQFG